MSIPTNTAATYKSNLMVGAGNTLDPFVGLGAPLGALILQPRKASFSTTTLGSTEKIYVGNQSNIATLALWVANQNFSYAVQELPHQNFQITITVPYDEITNTDNLVTNTIVWEIQENVVNRDIFDAGIFTTNAQNQLDTTRRYTVPPIVRTAIKEALKYGAFGNLNFTKINGTALTVNQIAEISKLSRIANEFFYLLKSGVTSVKSATIHVKRTGVYSINNPSAYNDNPYYTKIMTANAQQAVAINPIISWEDLINIFRPDPVTITQLLRSYLIPKSSAGAPFYDPITSFAIGGYLIHVPIREFLTPTKIRVTQMFEFDEWLDNCYTRFSPLSHFPLLYTTPYPPGYTNFPLT
jgi:preprotein translocase subunit SecB